MAGNSAIGPVSAAIMGLLNVASLKAAYPTGAGCVGGVTDAPTGTTFPVLWYELSAHDLGAFGEGPDVTQLQLRLHVFSTQPNMVEAQRIMREAIRLVKYQAPAATGYDIPTIGRPQDEIPLPLETLNGVAVRELVTIWDLFACEQVA
jgi:hypothetical protein